MKWFYEKYVRPSSKNGSIQIMRDLGRWQVSVQDCGQTTSYTHAMWVDAYKRLLKKTGSSTIKKVLMLGLGAGGELKLLHKTFPDCRVTAVEYDEEMVRLTHELALYKPYPAPEIVLGDAAQVVPALAESYDLIIVDLFYGPEPSPLSTDENFIRALGAHLAPGGRIFFNVYGRPDYLETPKRFFSHSDEWKFALNHLGLFSGPKE